MDKDEVNSASDDGVTKQTESPADSGAGAMASGRGSDTGTWSSIDDFLDTADRAHRTSKSEKARQFEKSGGLDEAEKDFDKLVVDLGGTKPKTDPKGVRSSRLPDGTTVSVRPQTIGKSGGTHCSN